MSSEVEVLQNDLQQLHSQLMLEREQTYSLKSSLSQAQTQIATLKATVDRKHEENKKLCMVVASSNDKQQIKALHEENEALVTQVQTLKLLIAGHHDKQSRETEPTARQSDSNSQTQSMTNNSTRPDSASTGGDSRRLEAANLELQRQLDRATSIWKRDEKRYQAEAKALQEKVDQVTMGQQRAAETLQSTDKEKEDLSNEIVELKAAHAKQLEDMDANFRSVSRKKTQATAQLTALQTSLAKTNSDLESSRANVESLTQQLANLEADNDELAQQLDKAKVDLDNANVSVAESSSTIATLREEKVGFETKLGELQGLCETLRTEKQTALDTFATYKSKEEDRVLGGKIAAKKAAQMIKQLKSQLAKVVERCDQLEREREKLVQQHTVELQEKQHELDNLERKVASQPAAAAPQTTTSTSSLQSGATGSWISSSTLASRISKTANRLGKRVDTPPVAMQPPPPPPSSEGDEAIKFALAKRLEGLLTENQTVREQVTFLEGCVQSLTTELESTKKQHKYPTTPKENGHPIPKDHDKPARANTASTTTIMEHPLSIPRREDDEHFNEDEDEVEL